MIWSYVRLLMIDIEMRSMHTSVSEFCSGAVIFALSDKDMEDLEKQELDIPVVVYNRGER